MHLRDCHATTEQHISTIIENGLCAVAVMEIDIKDGDLCCALITHTGQRLPRCYRSNNRHIGLLRHGAPVVGKVRTSSVRAAADHFSAGQCDLC